MGRNTNYARNILLNDSDFDDDFEITALLALEEERLERERASTSHYGFVPGQEKDEYFVRKRNATGVLGLSSLQKMTAALRMLAYGVAADFTNEYVRIGESTAIESLKKFVEAIVDIYSTEYLRSPNSNDIARLLRVSESCGFLGMLGSIDCMHWKWKNCPSGWKSKYIGQSREPTIILEAVASYDLWI
ncbi:uncharacterized protein LOC142612290 [Castanea sativa]|uniref:uncharacterized protein LOC142612290 n=1 Tax=Castanea sativa TaxID=21020 RepID=UPI003F650C86